MGSSAEQILSRWGVSARVESEPEIGGAFLLVFRRAAAVARFPCRGPRPGHEAPGLLLDAAIREAAFFDECDDVLEWADELGLSVSDPAVLAEFKAFDEARTALIGLISQADYDALKLELAIGQAISAAASGLPPENE